MRGSNHVFRKENESFFEYLHRQGIQKKIQVWFQRNIKQGNIDYMIFFLTLDEMWAISLFFTHCNELKTWNTIPVPFFYLVLCDDKI